MKKKMLNLSAIVLTLCLLIGALPLSVSAAESYSVTFEYDYSKGFAGRMDGGDPVSANTRVTVCVNPDVGYEVDEVYYINSGGTKIKLTYGGSAVPGQNNNFSYYFTMPSENVKVCATFKDASAYRVTVQQPDNGRVAVKGAYTYREDCLDLLPGTDVDVCLYPEDGYVLDSVWLERKSNGQFISVGITSRYHTARFEMPPCDVTLKVTYRPAVNNYRLTVKQATGGTVSVDPSGDTFREDAYLRAYVYEEEGYRLDSLLVRINDIYLVEAEKVAFWYEFHMPSGDTTITPVFVARREIEYIWYDDNGSILDHKIGYEGRTEPVTDAVPHREPDAEGEFTFDHWEKDYHYNPVIYRPVFRRSAHGAEFRNVQLSKTSGYPGDLINITARLVDLETEKLITRSSMNFILLKDGETIFSGRAPVNTPREDYRYENVRGYFKIPDKTEAGKYTLRLYYNGDEGETAYDTEITVLAQTNASLTLTAPRQAAAGEVFEAEGTLKTDSGDAVANATIYIAHNNRGVYSSAVTDGNGNFKRTYSITDEGLATLQAENTNTQYSCETAEAPIYIYGGDHSVTVSQAEHGTAHADISSAKCGDVVTLTATPKNGYRLKEWEVVSGGIEIENDSFVMLTQDVEIKPVFESNTHTVTIVLGDYGEDITATVTTGERLFNGLDKEGVFNTLFEMDTDEYIFRDLATKPLSEFANEEEFGNDAWELLETKVTGDMTVYAGFYKKIKNVNLTLTPPAAGTNVTVTENDDIYTQTPSPVITLADGAHCTVCEGSAVWYAENYEGGMFEGTFEKGKTYLADFMLMPDFGYWLDNSTVVTANGAAAVDSYGRMTLVVSLSAKTTEPYLLGDANGDGAVTIEDVTVIQRHLAELEHLDGVNLLAADANQNGELDISDATHLQMYLAELFDDSPIGTIIG